MHRLGPREWHAYLTELVRYFCLERGLSFRALARAQFPGGKEAIRQHLDELEQQ